MTLYSVPDMSCSHCKAMVEKTVHDVDPAAKLTVYLEQGQIDLETSRTEAVLTALDQAGYTAEVA